MEVKESNDHRVYMAEYGIPTIQLGCGGVIVSDLSFEGEEMAGIGFSLGEGEIGESHNELNGKNATDVGVFFQIIATSSDSLQVMIEQLEKAKASMANTPPIKKGE